MTELVFILDRSGSMAGMESDTLGGFNSMIEKQREEEGEAYVSTILFSNSSEVIHDRLPLKEIPRMTGREYRAHGCTALLDAVGEAIHHISRIHKYARAEDRPEKTLFIITTDGLENASRHYDYARVKDMIRHEQEKYGWEFLFLGADIDVAAEAQRMGIRPERAVSYRKTEDGMDHMFCLAHHVVKAARAGTGFEDCIRDFSERESGEKDKKSTDMKRKAFPSFRREKEK